MSRTTDPARNGIVLLCGDFVATRAIYAALAQKFGPVTVIVEDPLPRGELVRRRLRSQGFLRVVGQFLFLSVCLPLLRLQAARRISQLEEQLPLSPEFPHDVVRVPSVNSAEAREALIAARPVVVIVSGTRIISQQTLGAVRVPFINMHSGITPGYRGVHGGYWALVDRNPKDVGTTVHYIDAGIDTGEPIAFASFAPEPEDSFVTYPYLHTAAGLPLLIEAVSRALNGTLAPTKRRRETQSVLRSHPTIWEYLAHRLLHGVK
ncbi:MAG: formyl transferase [Gemmatimonadota bacterium]|nr:formyl transferase [Gemmatimonadota bacterium]